MCISVLPACMCVLCVCLVPQGPEEGVSSGTGATNGWELPHGCWELKQGPLEEQPELSTTEPSPALLEKVFT